MIFGAVVISWNQLEKPIAFTQLCLQWGHTGNLKLGLKLVTGSNYNTKISKCHMSSILSLLGPALQLGDTIYQHTLRYDTIVKLYDYCLWLGEKWDDFTYPLVSSDYRVCPPHLYSTMQNTHIGHPVHPFLSGQNHIPTSIRSGNGLMLMENIGKFPIRLVEITGNGLISDI